MKCTWQIDYFCYYTHTYTRIEKRIYTISNINHARIHNRNEHNILSALKINFRIYLPEQKKRVRKKGIVYFVWLMCFMFDRFFLSLSLTCELISNEQWNKKYKFLCFIHY